MARKSSNSGDGSDEILSKGLSSISHDSSAIKEDTKSIKSGINSLKSSTTSIKKSLNDIDKATTNAAGELKSISKDAKELKASMKAIEAALKNQEGHTIQQTVTEAPDSGSKVMGTVPNNASTGTSLMKTPGTSVMKMDRGTTALINQGKETTEATKNLGNKVVNFFSGKTFFGKLLSTVVDGIIGSKTLSNTLMDIFKLGVFLFANVMRNLFGKHFGGITAILLSILPLLGGARRVFKGAQTAYKFLKRGKGVKMAAAAGVRAATKLPKEVEKARRAAKIKKLSSKTVASVAGTETKLLEDKAAKKAAKKAASKAAEKAAGKAAGKALSKGAAKSIAKKIPGLGVGAGLLFGAGRLAEGDLLGAGAEVLSGALPTLGDAAAGVTAGAGTPLAIGANAASVGIDAWLMKRDIDRAKGKTGKDKKKGKSKSKHVGEKAVAKEVTKKGAEAKTLKKILKGIGKVGLVLGALTLVVKSILNLLNSGPFSSGGGIRSWISSAAGAVSSVGQTIGQTVGGAINNFTSGGFDSHKITGKYHESRPDHLHAGVDLGYSRGEEVKAKLGGKVVAADVFQGYGNTVIIDDGDAYELYGHLDSITPGIKGSTVSRGDVIGKAGDSGKDKYGRKVSTGVHLHYEVRKKKKKGAAYSDYTFFKQLTDTDPIAYTNSKNKATVPQNQGPTKSKDQQVKDLVDKGVAPASAYSQVYGQNATKPDTTQVIRKAVNGENAVFQSELQSGQSDAMSLKFCKEAYQTSH